MSFAKNRLISRAFLYAIHQTAEQVEVYLKPSHEASIFCSYVGIVSSSLCLVSFDDHTIINCNINNMSSAVAENSSLALIGNPILGIAECCMEHF